MWLFSCSVFLFYDELSIAYKYKFDIPLIVYNNTLVFLKGCDKSSLVPAWISNYTHYNVWVEITYPFLNFNGATVEV